MRSNGNAGEETNKSRQPRPLASSTSTPYQLVVQSTVNKNYDNLPIFLSHNSSFVKGGKTPKEDFGLFSPDYSNLMYKNCNSWDEYEQLQEVLDRLISCHSYSPTYLFNPLTLLCFIINPINKRKVKIRLAFDNCSNVTILEEETAKKLDLDGKNVQVSFSGTGGSSQKYGNQKDVQFLLQSLDGRFTTPLIQAATLPTVSHGFEIIKTDPKKYEYLSGIDDYTEVLPMRHKHFKKFGKVQLLLGLPYEAHFGPSSKTLGPKLSDPIAFHSPLGSCISAAMRRNQSLSQSMQIQELSSFDIDEDGEIICNERDMKNCYPDLTQFMRLDLVGIQDFPEENNDVTFEEQRARELLMERTVYCPEKKEYYTCLPWKDIKIKENNRSRALASTYQWIRKLQQKNPAQLDQWIQECQHFIDCGFVVKVPKEDLEKEDGFHYVQTFPVSQPGKLDHPVRIVFSANQKQKISKKSLNDHLLTGPCNIQDLVLMVVRFRTYFYVFGLDISRMFLRFKLHDDEQEYLRFFLVKKGKNGKIEVDSYRCTG